VAIIDSWDGTINPLCPVGCAPDLLNVRVDGVVVFSKTFGSQPGNADFTPVSPESIAPFAQYGFNGSYLDAAFDLGNRTEFISIPHTAATLTIEWFGSGAGYIQGGDDESFGIDKVAVTLNGTAVPTLDPVPEPTSVILLGTGVTALITRARQRKRRQTS
jgi:hypothetical protein